MFSICLFYSYAALKYLRSCSFYTNVSKSVLVEVSFDSSASNMLVKLELKEGIKN